MKAWTNGGVKVPKNVLDVVEKAAVDAYGRDEEACGYLEGPESDALLCDRAVELENLANKYHQIDPEGHPRTGHDYFKINAKKFERALDEGEKSGRPVKVFFHSHLDCGAYFSEEDDRSMTMGGTDKPSFSLAYLVTAVDGGTVTAHKLFVWKDPRERFVEVPLEILDGA